jgi:hypothetical protein
MTRHGHWYQRLTRRHVRGHAQPLQLFHAVGLPRPNFRAFAPTHARVTANFPQGGAVKRRTFRKYSPLRNHHIDVSTCYVCHVAASLLHRCCIASTRIRDCAGGNAADIRDPWCFVMWSFPDA